MQATALQDKTQKETENRNLTSNKIDTALDVIIIEQKISEVEVKYKQKRQKLQKSILVTKDVLPTRSKISLTCNRKITYALSICW